MLKIQPLIPLCCSIGIVSIASITHAQTPPSTRIPVADNTLGTQVTGTNSNFTITGGVNRGQNVFHSFQDFSIPTGGAATFFNPTGNQAIITRVTGNLFSDIDGIINTQGANFFLINPNGILFGANTQLNVGQTFVGSTANGIDFVDGSGRSYRFGIGGNDAPLLSIDPNALLTPARLILNGNNGQISNLGTLETPNFNQYIGLIGGNVSIDGGQINAQGGRVEIGGLSAAGTVGLGIDGNILRAQFPANVARSDVSFYNAARVNVAWDGGGDIAITARNLELLGGSVLRGGIESGLGTAASVAGDINLNATGAITIGGGGIGNNIRADSIGRGGNINIQAGTFSVRDKAQIQASTAGIGNPGNINVKVAGAIDISGIDTSISSLIVDSGQGNGGNLTIEAGSVLLRDGAQLTASSYGIGNVGNVKITANGVILTGSNTTIFSAVEAGGVGTGGTIEINANNLSIINGGELSASVSGTGQAGNVLVNVRDTVFLSDARITSNVNPGGVGNGGTIEINATNLSLANGGQIQAAARRAANNQPAGQGNAGNINVKVTDAVDISGTQNGFSSGIFSLMDIGTIGTGGDINIEAGSVSLRSSGTLDSSTSGTGNAGNIKLIVTGAVSFSNSNLVSTVETNGIGKGGTISINAASLSLTDGAQFTTKTAGIGNAGNIVLIIKNAVSFSNSTAITSVETGGIGKGGSIDLTAASLSLIDGAQMNTNTQLGGTGDAGTITITATDFVNISGKNDTLFSGLLVTSRSANGAAGDLTISAPKITLDNGGILAAQSAYGTGGNINISNANLLRLRRGGQISATTGGISPQTSNGGNITINLPNGFIVAAPNENSDITANAFGGNGGKVTINSQQNFWISSVSRSELERRLGTTNPTELDPISLATNDITAISQISPNLSGQININPPGIDITAGLTPLPNNVTNPADRINPNCSPTAIANNSFTNIGRGGIPASPKDPLNQEQITANWVRLNPQHRTPSIPMPPTTQVPPSIVEAQGWQRASNGDILLVAQSASNRSFPPSPPRSGCLDPG